MPNRIDDTFAQLRANHKKGFIAYICAGDPDFEQTRRIALALAEAGVDLLELGVPFSDPLADGIVNQMAAQRALEGGATSRGVLQCVRTIRRDSQIPIVLYTYVNPLYQFGSEEFHRAAAEAGVDGLLILDLPLDEEQRNAEFAERAGLKHIRLIAPTTPPARMATIAAGAEGFIYYVSREGVTGEQATVSASIAEQVEIIRQSTDLPIAVGFGISNPEQAREVAQSADAVVVGSAIVKQIALHGKEADCAERIGNFVRPLTAAVAGA